MSEQARVLNPDGHPVLRDGPAVRPAVRPAVQPVPDSFARLRATDRAEATTRGDDAGPGGSR